MFVLFSLVAEFELQLPVFLPRLIRFSLRALPCNHQNQNANVTIQLNRNTNGRKNAKEIKRVNGTNRCRAHAMHSMPSGERRAAEEEEGE